MWLTITDAQKRVAPDADALRQLATHHPEARKVERDALANDPVVSALTKQTSDGAASVGA